MSDDPRREAAITRLKAKRAFQSNVVAYIAVNAILWAIWAISGFGYPWPIFVSGFWGLGLAMHAWSVWGQKPITEADVEREIQRGGDVVE